MAYEVLVLDLFGPRSLFVELLPESHPDIRQ